MLAVTSKSRNVTTLQIKEKPTGFANIYANSSPSNHFYRRTRISFLSEFIFGKRVLNCAGGLKSQRLVVIVNNH